VTLRFEHIDLRLCHTFTIARGSRDIDPSVIVMIEHEGVMGIGEASPSGRYNESSASVASFLSKIDLSSFHDPFRMEEILSYVNGLAPSNMSAKAAVDIALHDWVGKKLGIPLWRYWGLDDRRTPITSMTIGIDNLTMIAQKVLEASAYPVLKVKVGVGNDEEIITTIRKLTDKNLRVDANEGWHTREEALKKILWLESQGVEFVEQPMPADQIRDIAWLRGRIHIPMIADESVMSIGDIHLLMDAFDGINIKLMKCGGMREALKMIYAAHAAGMKVMLGCMIESSVGISAAAQLSPLVDYADLDGNILISNDPFDGVQNQNGKLLLNNRPGLGVQKRTPT
jgi:L-alanine-DL-glutamate epimerase-like enolase superfamily enzyme